MVTADRFSGAQARRLLRHMRHGSLATLDRETGLPYASLVNFATDLAGLPVIFISRLARHAQNLLFNPGASLLAVDMPAARDVLTASRVTVLGTFQPIASEALAERYGDHHPGARMYLDFTDFSFWRLSPRLVHGVAGFGRIETLDADEVFLPSSGMAAFGELARSAASHLNEDHPDVVRLFAARLSGHKEGDWRVTSIDPDGALIEGRSEAVRRDFDRVVTTSEELREAFVRLVDQTKIDGKKSNSDVR
jgi:putative heme iron utilization protein